MISELGARVDAQPRSFCHCSVVQAWAHAGNTSKATRWLTTSLDAGIDMTPPSFDGVIAALVKAGELVAAERWLTRMSSLGIRPLQMRLLFQCSTDRSPRIQQEGSPKTSPGRLCISAKSASERWEFPWASFALLELIRPASPAHGKLLRCQRGLRARSIRTDH